MLYFLKVFPIILILPTSNILDINTLDYIYSPSSSALELVIETYDIEKLLKLYPENKNDEELKVVKSTSKAFILSKSNELDLIREKSKMDDYC